MDCLTVNKDLNKNKSDIYLHIIKLRMANLI